jgi:tetratricopeptide (TPR) repeat protein
LRRERPDLLPGAFQRLGDAYLALGRFAEAEAAYRGLSAQGTGVGYPPSAIAQHGLALAIAWQGRDADAEAAFRTALAQPERPQDPPSRRAAATHAAYSDFLRRRGRIDEALREAREAAGLVALGDDDPIRAQALASLALAQLAGGDTAHAPTTADNAVVIARRVLPAKNWQLAPPLYALAQADLSAGKPDEARTLIDEAITISSPPHPPNDPRIGELRTLLAHMNTRPTPSP